ncbi:MAG: acyl-CoA synthetase [Bacteroidetes bacterium HGW-Bacteroidetes-7]|jgi:long-chain acyl-CoA synthetase|nr:MAG: acyl-CoA synthetase [Bacteroidetes bacterium HGW-Bacteroidetes-7]
MKNDNEYSTLRDIYSASVKNYGERMAFSLHNKENITYKEVSSRVDNLIDLFDKAGIESGQKVALLGNNMPNWAVSYFAITVSGRVVVPVLPDFTAFEIINVLDHSDASAIIVSSKLEYKIHKHISDKLPLIIRMDTLEPVKVPTDSALVKTSEPKHDDIASIIYTSGTSGASKGVMLTHSNLVHHTKMTYKLFPILKEDTFLSILPLSHAYECSIGMMLPFYCGASVVYLDGSPTPSLLMPALKEVKPTVMLSVPLIVEKIYKIKIRPMFTKNIVLRILYSVSIIRRALHKLAGKKLLETFGGRLRFFGIGGSRIDGVVEHFLADAGFPYGIGYGLTETSPLLAGATPGKVMWQSTGPAIDGVQLKIFNPNKEKIGEVLAKGPNIMKGYYKDPDTTKASFTSDGWFITKDLGYIDKKGNLFIKGRRDNMMLGPNGENIYPEDIESVINEFDLVLESLVVQKKGKLVAKVHFNYEEIKNGLLEEGDGSENITDKLNKIKAELVSYVNERVNKFSRLSEITEQPVPFEKTATLKIKRYLYS